MSLETVWQFINSPLGGMLIALFGTFVLSRFPTIGPLIQTIVSKLFPPPVPPQQAALDTIDKAVLKAYSKGVSQDAVSERVAKSCPHGCAFSGKHKAADK